LILVGLSHRTAPVELRERVDFQGRLEPALGHLEQAARLDPGDRESRLAAEMLRGRGQAPEGSPPFGERRLRN
jgi:hypothetical protein